MKGKEGARARAQLHKTFFLVWAKCRLYSAVVCIIKKMVKGQRPWSESQGGKVLSPPTLPPEAETLSLDVA